MTFRLIVSGDRRLADYPFVRATLDRLLATRLPDVVIIQGCATGADDLAVRYAKERGLLCEDFPADWETYGRSAGPRRNAAMLDAKPDGVIVFSAGGPGSQDMIRQADRRKVPLRIADVRRLIGNPRRD